MNEPIKLPPLPEHDYLHDDVHAEYGYASVGSAHSDAQLEAYARAAVEADRQTRGEPVAWRQWDGEFREFRYYDEISGFPFGSKKSDMEPLYTEP